MGKGDGGAIAQDKQPQPQIQIRSTDLGTAAVNFFQVSKGVTSCP
jgi:hypothetical protein